MADELGHLSAEIALDINPFLNNQRTLEAQIKRTGNLLTQMERSFKTAGSSIGSNSIFKTQIAQMQMLDKEVDNYRNKFNAAKKDLASNPTVDNERALGTTATNLQKTALQYDQVRLAAARTLQEQRAASSIFGQGSRMIGDYGNKLQSVATDIKSIGSGALTAGIGTGFIAAAHSAMTFKSEIQAIGPLLSDDGRITAQVTQQLNTMSQSSLKWSQQYGISTSEINNAMTELVRRGFTAQQTLGSMPAILNASRASGEGLGTVMQATASSIEMFGLKADTTSQQIKNTNRVTDVLTVAANKTASSFADISAAMTYVGPTAAQAHMSIEQVAAAIGALSNKGIEASTAGTTLRQVLTKLTSDTPSNRKNMQAIGVDIDEIKKKGVDLPKLIDQINGKLKDKTPTEKMSLLNAAFGKLGQGIMALFEKSNKSSKSAGQELQNLQDELEKAGGTTKRIADQMNNTPEAKWQRFLQTLKATAIEIGGNVLPAFEGVLKPAQNLAQAFGKLPTSQQQAIVSMLAFTAALKPLSSLVAAPISGLGKLENAFKKVYDFGAKLSGGSLKSALSDVDKIAGTADKAESTANSFQKLGSAALSTGNSVKGAAQGFSAIGQEVGGVASASATAESAIASVGTAGTEAAAGTATLGTSLVATAAGLGIAAGAAVVAVGAFVAIKNGVIPAVQALIEHGHEVHTWGSDVGSQTSHAADSFKNFSSRATQAMNEAKNGVHGNAKSIKDDFDGMAKAAESNAKKTDSDLKKLAKDLGGTAGASITASRQENNDKNSTYLKNIQKDQKLADQILTTAAKQGGKISADSRVYLNNIQADMTSNFVKTLDVSKSTAKAMQESIQGTFNKKVSSNQYRKVLSGFVDGLEEEAKQTSAKMDELKSAYNKGELSYSQYIQAKEALGDDDRAKTEELLKGEVAFMRSQGDSWDSIRSQLKAQGDATDGEIDEAIQKFKKGASDIKSALADTTGNISKDAKKAGDAWNKLVFDPKTGKIKTNATEVIADMAKTDKGWKQLKFIEKNAKLGVKGKEQLAEGIIEAGKWNKLDIDEKYALIRSKGVADIGFALDLEDQWNNMNPKVIDLMVKASGKKELLESLTDINNWNLLTPEQKKIIIGEFSGFDKLRLELNDIKEWNALPAKEKKAIIKAAGKGELEDALKKAGVWNALPNSMRKQIEAIDDASPKVKTAQAGLDKLNKTKASPQVKLESSDVTTKLSTVQKIMNGISGKTVTSKWNFQTQPGESVLQNTTNGLNKINGKQVNSTMNVAGIPQVVAGIQNQKTFNGTPSSSKSNTMSTTGANTVQDGTTKQKNFNGTPASSKNNKMSTSGRGEVQDGTNKQRNFNSTKSSSKNNHIKTSGASELQNAINKQHTFNGLGGHFIQNTIRTVQEFVKKVTGKKTGTAGAWRSVPHFAHGTPNDGWEGGPVIVGDGHRREVVSDPELGLFTTPDHDTLMNLNRGAIIWRSVEAFQNAMWHAGIKNYPHFANGTTNQSLVGIADSIPDNTDEIVAVLSKQGNAQNSKSNNDLQETNELIATLVEQNNMLVQAIKTLGFSFNVDGKQFANAQAENNSKAINAYMKQRGMGFS